MIIHNELDYRLPIGEGLAPFNVLQTSECFAKASLLSTESGMATKSVTLSDVTFSLMAATTFLFTVLLERL